MRETILTKDQCTSLYKTLKPEEIHLDSKGSNLFEVLFDLQELVRITVVLANTF